MESSGELWTGYMQRTGISDSEMARHLGLSRRTIFRWKEGMTTRPRDRSGWSLDTRGIVCAESGRYVEAADEFENFVRWLDMQPAATRDAFAPGRLPGMETLRAGKTPFDPATLNQLRGAP